MSGDRIVRNDLYLNSWAQQRTGKKLGVVAHAYHELWMMLSTPR
jgi:hypothetical protein